MRDAEEVRSCLSGGVPTAIVDGFGAMTVQKGCCFGLAGVVEEDAHESGTHK